MSDTQHVTIRLDVSGYTTAMERLTQRMSVLAPNMVRLTWALRRGLETRRTGHRHRGTRAWAHRYCAHSRGRCTPRDPRVRISRVTEDWSWSASPIDWRSPDA